MSSNELLTTIEVAKKLGIKRQTLDMWRSKGRGPAWVKMGFNVRYRADDVKAYLAGLQQRDSPNEEAQALRQSEDQRELQELRVEFERLGKTYARLKSKSKKLGAAYREQQRRVFTGAFKRKDEMAFFNYSLEELIHEGDELFLLSDDEEQWKLVDSAEEVEEHLGW